MINNFKKIQSLLIVCILFFLSDCYADNKWGVSIQADKLNINHTENVAYFSGNIKATYKNLSISCNNMSIFYSPQGRLLLLKAWGNVKIKSGKVTAGSDKATLDAKTKIFILEGQPFLVRGHSKIKGSSIRVTLETGKIEILDAEGIIEFEEF